MKRLTRNWLKLAVAIGGDLAILLAVVAGVWLAGVPGAIIGAILSGLCVYHCYRRNPFGEKPPKPLDFHLNRDR